MYACMRLCVCVCMYIYIYIYIYIRIAEQTINTSIVRISVSMLGLKDFDWSFGFSDLSPSASKALDPPGILKRRRSKLEDYPKAPK